MPIHEGRIQKFNSIGLIGPELKVWPVDYFWAPLICSLRSSRGKPQGAPLLPTVLEGIIFSKSIQFQLLSARASHLSVRAAALVGGLSQQPDILGLVWGTKSELHR